MDTRALGSLQVSVVGVGCNNFGSRLDQAGTTNVVLAHSRRASRSSTPPTSTAPPSPRRCSASRSGLAATRSSSRASSACRSTTRTSARSPAYVRSACEDSLRRLGTDHIDLYQLHYPDDTVPIADTLGALRELVEAGKVREIGCSNLTVAQLHEAKAAAGDGPAFVSVQNQYSLLEREPERDGVLEACGGPRHRLPTVLSARQRTPHRQGASRPTDARGVAAREDGARAQRALVGRRHCRPRSPRCWRTPSRSTCRSCRSPSRGCSATTWSRASSPAPPTPTRCAPTRTPCER